MRKLVNKKFSVQTVAFMVIATLFIGGVIFQYNAGAAETFYPYQYDLVSNGVEGTDVGIDQSAIVRSVSEDGNIILFSSSATNLPGASGSNGAGYIKNMTTGVTTRIDTSESGQTPPPGTSSLNFQMSSTGRFIVFFSSAGNLIDGETKNTTLRFYMKDMLKNTVTLMSDINSANINWLYTYATSVSDDGRYTLFTTMNVNSILPGTRPASATYSDTLLYDMANEEWLLLSRGADGLMPPHSTVATSATCDGALILMSSPATNLVEDHSGTGSHVYLVDIRGDRKITDITAGSTGDSTSAKISCNGRHIAYSTTDRTLITPTPTTINSEPQLVLMNRITEERKYISWQYPTAMIYSKLPSKAATISDDGDVLMNWAGSTSAMYQDKVYFRDMSDGSETMSKVLGTYQGLVAYQNSFLMSSDGKYVVVSSQDAYNLGLTSQQPDSYNLSPRNIIRIKTGQ